MSMVVLLPVENDGLEDVERGLTADTVTKVMESLETHYVNLRFPKFKIERALPAKELLIQVTPISADFLFLLFAFLCVRTSNLKRRDNTNLHLPIGILGKTHVLVSQFPNRKEVVSRG